MSPIVVRFDLSPDAAEVAHRALGVYLDQAVIQPLSQEPVPRHTKRRLEEQKAHLEATRRDLKKAIDSPIEVDEEGREIVEPSP